MNIKKGISLIVLVITIIVMIVLAATIIISLTNNNVIDNANKAVEDTELANAKILAQTAWADAYAAGNRTQEDLEREVKEKLEANRFDANKYKITVSTKGVEVEKNPYENWEIGHELTAEEKEKYYKLTGTRSSSTTGVENDGTAQTFTTTDGELEGLTWIYIGMDNDGNHLITTSEPQQPGTKNFTLRKAKAWLDIKNGTTANPSQLDKVCKELYGKGGTQKVARSMNIEDVERILGYTGEKTAYYSTSGSYTPITDGKDKISELETKEGRTFTAGKRKTPNSPSVDDANFGDIRSDYYRIDKTSDVGEMAKTENVGLVYRGTTYWLASQCVWAYFYDGFAGFYVRYVSSSRVGASDLFTSGGYSDANSYAVRPVVSI